MVQQDIRTSSPKDSPAWRVRHWWGPGTCLGAAALIALTINLLPVYAEPGSYMLLEQSTSDRAHTRLADRMAPEPTKANAASLCQKILNAYGGEAKMRELETLVFRSKGKIKEISSISHAENAFDLLTVSKGNKLRMELTIMGQPLITGYDGKVGWLKQGDQVFPADPASIEHMQDEISHSLDHELLDLVEPAARIKVLDDKEVNGKQCAVLSVRLPSTAFIMYADKATHLIVRTEFNGIDADSGMTATVLNDYFDYREMCGSQEPFKVVEYTNGQKTTEATQDTEDVDSSIDDGYFAMPKEPTIAGLEKGPIELPFDFAYNQILVKAKLNDGQEIPFIVDTGASQCMLDEKVAKTLGTLQDEGYHITTGGGTMDMKYIIAKKVQLGKLTIDNLAFGTTDGAAFAQLHASRPAGLLGANVLKRFLVTIDYTERKITLADPRTVKVPAHAAVITTKPAMGNLGAIVVGKLDGLTVPFLVDTGAAFNNISADLVKPILDEQLLPVSKILGLDGQMLSVGAVRFKTLQLGDTKIDKPIFSVASAPLGASGRAIITSKTIAILGNPLWSKYRITIDYRHNRLILEVSEQQAAFDAADDQLTHIRIQLGEDGDYAKALAACQRMLSTPQARQFPSVGALIHAEIGTTIVDQARKKSDHDLMLSAKKDFMIAESMANECQNPTAQAKIFAKLARHIADVDRSLVPMANTLINKALKLAPMDAEVLVSGAFVLKQMAAPEVTQTIVDSALSADPANWDALWLRYNLAKQMGKQKDQQLVAAQLRRYYPDAPEVTALENNGPHATKFGVGK